MPDNETIEVLVILFNDLGHTDPGIRLYLGGIKGRGETVGIDTVSQAFDFRDQFHDLLEINSLQRTVCRIIDHPDGSTGINQ